MPGHASGKVTRRNTANDPAPCTCAASSSAGFIERNTAAVMMKASGARLRPCTQPMPSTVMTLIGGPGGRDSECERNDKRDQAEAERIEQHRISAAVREHLNEILSRVSEAWI